MLIPHLHFCGDCQEAIGLYEKAFNTKADEILHANDYDPQKYAGDMRISHAEMKIHDQKVFLNDWFGNKDKSLDYAVHLIVQFKTSEELLSCYDVLKEGSSMQDLFVKTFYSELVGNFMDKFGVLWGFMVA